VTRPIVLVRGSLMIALALVATILLPAASARASVSCKFFGSSVGVTLSAPGDFAQIRAAQSGFITVNGNVCKHIFSGTAATRFNTDRISVTGAAEHQHVLISQNATDPFAPGLSDEPGGSDEIEFVIDLKDGIDIVEMGAGGPIQMRWGAAGINMNAFEQDGIDADVTTSNVETFRGTGGSFNDILSGKGGAGTGGGFPTPLVLTGLTGNDEIVGGVAGDTLHGHDGNDKVTGGLGADTIEGDQSTAGNDTLNGGQGPDTITGDGGSDIMNGDDASDTMHAMDGVSGNDTVNGGASKDTCDFDPGDTLISCP